MNNFDKQRIENEIWILEQYEYEIKQIARERYFDSWDYDRVFEILAEVKEQLNK